MCNVTSKKARLHIKLKTYGFNHNIKNVDFKPRKKPLTGRFTNKNEDLEVNVKKCNYYILKFGINCIQ